jgi:anti-sigma factor ChrR (cupin superfamily)
VEVKVLYYDPEAKRATTLLRFAPGATYPMHLHNADEQCLVLEGDLRWRDLVFRQGDFVVAKNATIHPTICSEQGCLALIVSGRNEFVAV